MRKRRTAKGDRKNLKAGDAKELVARIITKQENDERREKEINVDTSGSLKP